MLNVNSADVVTDFNGLAKLKNEARAEDPEALKQVAKQFESLFLNMVLKSMRQAKLSDGLLDSDQSEFYQEMHDQQLSMHLAGERGIGMADLIVKQLSPKQSEMNDGKDVSDYIKFPATSDVGSTGLTVYERAKLGLLRRDWPDVIDGASSKRASLDDELMLDETPDFDGYSSKSAFVQQLLPMARQAADELGVEPRILIAQAALETGWGRSVIKNRDGSSSYNLFNIKAGNSWEGKQARVSTLEFEGGVPKKVLAGFRAYDSYADSFNDYVRFIKEKPRYADALRQASDPKRYIQALQQAGYATDPRYAGKVMTIYNSKAFTANASAETVAMR